VSAANVRYEGQPGKHMLALSSSQFDPERTSTEGLPSPRRPYLTQYNVVF
jgi:hypothetical protein